MKRGVLLLLLPLFILVGATTGVVMAIDDWYEEWHQAL